MGFLRHGRMNSYCIFTKKRPSKQKAALFYRVSLSLERLLPRLSTRTFVLFLIQKERNFPELTGIITVLLSGDVFPDPQTCSGKHDLAIGEYSRISPLTAFFSFLF